MVLWLVTIMLVAACSGSSSGPASTKYHQTWTKPYGSTTCGDWDDLMGIPQRFVMAADHLVTFWKRDLGRDLTVLPADNIINAYAGAISNECQDQHDLKVPYAATIVYDASPALFAPK